MRHSLTLGAVSLASALIGCVPLPQRGEHPAASCTVGTAWSTAYAASRPLESLAPGRVQVLRYRISVHPDRGVPCGQLLLIKHLTILRGDGPLHIAEVRNFYLHGRLVASHRALIGHVLTSSGNYKARLTLPIPGSAPYGRYRMVSLLYARWGTQASRLIAQARTGFMVGPKGQTRPTKADDACLLCRH